jgi:Protein of unknown function (DUF3761)
MKARQWGVAWCLAVAMALAVPAVGAAQPKKPANATAQCKDGTYSTAKSKQGACSNHGGVGTWYADEKDTKTGPKTDTKTDTKTATKTADKDTKTATKTADKDAKTAAKTADSDTKTAAKDTKSSIPTVARPAGAPADSTAQCNDGTYSKAQTHQGACSSHKGVKNWFK